MTDAPSAAPLPALSLSLSHIYSPLLTSHRSSLPLSQSITRPYKLPLPCGECARVFPFYLFLLCSINLSVEPDAGRVSCIPNTKNNHFSVTGVGGCWKVERCVCVCKSWGKRGGVVEGLLAHRHETKPTLL